MDTDALIERYRKEIEDLKNRLAEREADSPVKGRRLSAREVCVVSRCLSNTLTPEVAKGRVEGDDGSQWED